MSTALGGPPVAPGRPPEQDDERPSNAVVSATGSAEPRTCAKCGSPLAPDQDWCLQCGAAASGALGPPMWRSTGAVFAALGVLAIGAAAAAVAALNQHAPARRTVTNIVAQTPPPATPPATTTPTQPPATPPAAAKQASPQAPAKLPKIPLTASTPTTTTPPPVQNTPSGANTESSGSSGTSGGETGSSGGGSEGGSSTPSAILLDTDAASTYNPYGYPASYFGDPSRTIDGDHGTRWTAQVDPANAPAMAEGVLIDLKARKRLSALQLISPSKGMLVQVYGSTAAKAPASITEKAWVPLTAPLVLKKGNTHFKLRKSKQAFRFVTVWISRAPASAVGTPTAPGQVGIGEIELFPAS